MAVKNAYPELPEVKFIPTQVDPIAVRNYINAMDIPLELKLSSYTIFAIESGHGQKGVNNNYGGIQTDGGRWGQPMDSFIIATTVAVENLRKIQRRFAVFASWQNYVTALVQRLKSRGLYIGGTTHKIVNMNVDSLQNFTRAYTKEWIEGNAKIEPTKDTTFTVASIYNANKSFFSTGVDSKKKI